MALLYSSSSRAIHPAMGRGNAITWPIIFVAFLLAATASTSGAKVYKVGDEAGWIVSSNYSEWASSKIFRVGDTIVFIYNNSFHNVLEVNIADYRSCNSASPIATYATGNDSIAIHSYGHRFFICGFPGHCAGGQKLDIRVPKNISATASPSGAAVSSGVSPAPVDQSATPSANSSVRNGGGAVATMTGTGAVFTAVAVVAMVVALFE